MIKRILVGLGGTPQVDCEIAHALQLAKTHDAKVTAVTVVDVDRLSHIGPVPLGGGAAAEDLRQHRLHQTREKITEAIGQFQARCEQANVRYQVLQEEGEPHKIMAAASRFQDVVLFGLRDVFNYGVLDAKQEKPHDAILRFIAEGVRPILALSDDYREVRRVMIAYSGSVESSRMVKQVLRIAPWPDAQVRIVTIKKDADEGARLLAEVSEYCRDHGAAVETKFVTGTPKQQIFEEADDFDADVILMGNSARGLLSRKIFGETVLYCLQHADRPIFLTQ